MTASARRPAGGSRLLVRVQWTSALTAALALIALMLSGPANAASSGYDQITGVGTTASAVTVDWTQGILDTTNTAIASANAGRTDTTQTATDPLGFMHSDFENLKVTVSQTENITHQGITVTWSGGKPSNVGGFTDNFLQMMECYSDTASGPNPEQCEYGSPDLLNVPSAANGLGERVGFLCAAGAAPSVTNPPVVANGQGGEITGCDTEEPSDPTHIAPCPSQQCDPTDSSFDIPFAPVGDPTDLDYAFADTTYYNRFNTNEVQEAITGADGTGQQQFETLTGTEAPGLGCGDNDNGQPRGCWLVIVPRGTYEPNGYQVNGASNYLSTSPLDASNWAQRIQIHLSYAPVGQFCPIGTPSLDMDGTQIVTRAMQSWELALNQAAACSSEYSFIATTESSSTSDLTSGGTGVAFTTIPIGDEATRSGGSPPTDLPPILYAPVAISALDFGFNINNGNGYDTTPVKLTPLLVAKSLTQTYLGDLPDYNPSDNEAGPSWASGYPTNISEDPEFISLNPDIVPEPSIPDAPILTEDHSALNEQVWQWVQADSTASGWLDGTADATDGNIKIDPDYSSLNLGTSVVDSYPRAYTGTCVCGGPPEPGVTPPTNYTKDSGDLLPYSLNLDSAAAAVLAANNPATTTWSTTAISPSGSNGWYQSKGIEPIGSIFMWSASDTPDLAAYGLTAAQLCNESGSTCVAPSTASLTAAVTDAQPDSAGLLQVNPASPGDGAYPLVDVIYAAVSTNQSPANLNSDAALIKYAAGDGQTAGTAPGNLPPGYLPLTSALQSQAMDVVAKLQALANPSASPSPSPTSSVSATSSATSSSGSSSGGTSADGSQGGAQSQSPAGTSTAPATTSGGSTSAGSDSGGSGSGGSGSGGSGTSSTGAGSGATAGSTPRATASAAAAPTGSLSPSPGSSATTPGAVVSLPPSEVVSSGKTGPLALGNLRWALFAVVIVGALCAGGAMLLRSESLPTWLRRRIPAAWRLK
jgi:hypothetical protein